MLPWLKSLLLLFVCVACNVAEARAEKYRNDCVFSAKAPEFKKFADAKSLSDVRALRTQQVVRALLPEVGVVTVRFFSCSHWGGDVLVVLDTIETGADLPKRVRAALSTLAPLLFSQSESQLFQLEVSKTSDGNLLGEPDLAELAVALSLDELVLRVVEQSGFYVLNLRYHGGG